MLLFDCGVSWWRIFRFTLSLITHSWQTFHKRFKVTPATLLCDSKVALANDFITFQGYDLSLWRENVYACSVKEALGTEARS